VRRSSVRLQVCWTLACTFEAGGVADVEGVDLGRHEARIGWAVVVHDEVEIHHIELR